MQKSMIRAFRSKTSRGGCTKCQSLVSLCAWSDKNRKRVLEKNISRKAAVWPQPHNSRNHIACSLFTRFTAKSNTLFRIAPL